MQTRDEYILKQDTILNQLHQVAHDIGQDDLQSALNLQAIIESIRPSIEVAANTLCDNGYLKA